MAKKKASGAGKTVARIKEKQEQKAREAATMPGAEEPSLQAMVWYKEEDYQQLLSIFDDAHLLPQTYSHWLERAEAKKAEVEAAGDQVIKVFIDPQTFPEWCEKKGKAKDAEARSELAIEVAQAHAFSL